MIEPMKSWKDVNALYQIYPRSFYDDSRDGVGDLRGIIKKLAYLHGTDESLGVDAIWLSPFYSSPMADFGYDISNYCDVDPLFGTLDDFKELLVQAHKRDMKVMIDFVPNHTSVQHAWFQDSIASRSSTKRDYYVWRDAKADGAPPNNWLSVFGDSAWQWDSGSDQYYLHSFLSDQPDLNWSNPQVRKEMKHVLAFWLDMGVDGFRVDVARYIAKDGAFRDDPPNPAFGTTAGLEDPYHSLLHVNSQYGEHLFKYLAELTDVVASYEDRLMIFEDYPEESRSITDQYRDFYDINSQVAMPFNFQGLSSQWSAESFGGFVNDFQKILHTDEVPVYCFSNHDQSRLVTRYGKEQARLVGLFLLTLPGMPVLYYGEEIGMQDAVIAPQDIQDPAEKKMRGIGLGRDPERTPMQWNNKHHAGFSQNEPWLPIGADFKNINVENELDDPDSFLTLYRQLFRLRSENEILTKGQFNLISEDKSDVLAFERTHSEGVYLVVLNFAETPSVYDLLRSGKIICASHPLSLPEINASGQLLLRPFEAVVMLLDS
jgi:alpha-glucosidase